MKLSNDQFRTLARNFLTEAFGEYEDRISQAVDRGNLANLGHEIYAEVAYDMVDQAMATANVPPSAENKEQVQEAVDELFSSSEYNDLLALLKSLSQGPGRSESERSQRQAQLKRKNK
tara:strand:+ start:390 stop:743 length:354 start_codon:yes stop_codon:yes gene_type:complete